MSQKELDRHYLLRQVLSKQLTQAQAADLLELSDRQVRNLLKAFKLHGPKGIISKKRGKPSNRSVTPMFKKQVMDLVCNKYPDFGPTFACEKLSECHGLILSNETLRKWMIEANLWVSRKNKPCIHPIRPRRDCFGELIQIDGSHHYWFEDRAEKCVLIVFIDDATSKITSLVFSPTESLQGYFIALGKHIQTYGRPRSLYSDRHAIFGGSDKIHHAQFIRALRELEIDNVLARSPQAKGRVERVNKTLQDRLVKELRLRNISSIEEANNYLQEFMTEFNKKFSKEPRGQYDAHRPLASGYDLERTLTRCEIRTLSKDVSFSFHSKYYIVMQPEMINRLKNKKIEIRQKADGSFRVFYENKELKYQLLADYSDTTSVINKKLTWPEARRGHPNNFHPWKNYSFQVNLRRKEMEVVV